jgi:hypothetical protein
MSEAERSALVSLIDVAVKSAGLAVAGDADYLARKLKAFSLCEAKSP